MSTATTAKTGTTAPKDGMPSMLAYLTRVLKTPTIGAFWEELAEQARDQNWSHEEYLTRLPLLAALREGTVRDKTTLLRGKSVGPQGWTPHWFRHTHATALLLAGTPEWVVARRLGHAHVQTTLDLYGWVREDEALRAAANWTTYTSAWQVGHDR